MSHEKSLQDKVNEWVKEQGYPLEMYVAQSFRDANYIVTQSDIYVDSDIEKSREIDVVAYKNVQRTQYTSYKLSLTAPKVSEGATLTIGCCIECKTSHKPWVLFTDDNPLSQNFDFFSITSKMGERFLNQVTCRTEIPEVSSLNSIYPPRCGYSLTQAFTTGTDIPYQAALSAIKATAAKVAEEPLIHPFWGRAIPIYFPVIVIDSQLFECFLDEENEVEIRETDHGILWWNMPVAGYSSLVIQIFTKPALGKLTQWLEKVSEALSGCDQQLLEIGDDILEAYRLQETNQGT